MNLLLGVCLVLLAHKATSDYASLYGINGVQIWTEPDCQGIPAQMIFNETTLAMNITNICVSQSFRLLRPLQGQEQFDISIAPELDLWDPLKDQSRTNSFGCTSFIQSFFPTNGSKGCHNTPPFTCHRLWVNDGLRSDLSGPVDYSTPLHTWPLMIPSSCSKKGLSTPSKDSTSKTPHESSTPCIGGSSISSASNIQASTGIASSSTALFLSSTPPSSSAPSPVVMLSTTILSSTSSTPVPVVVTVTKTVTWVTVTETVSVQG